VCACVKLKKSALAYLELHKKDGKISLRQYNRINILLLLHREKRVGEIEEFLGVDRVTIWRTKKKYLTQGVAKALQEEDRPGQPCKYTTDHEAELTAMACGPCPQGRRRWTVRLLTEILKRKPGFTTINRESVRLALKKCVQTLVEAHVVHPGELTPQYRERMYRLLALYKEAYDPGQPLICMDEKSKQLLKDSRKAVSAKVGKVEKYDYEYSREGTCNIFIAVAPKWQSGS
jgi:Homeodomain-like domain